MIPFWYFQRKNPQIHRRFFLPLQSNRRRFLSFNLLAPLLILPVTDGAGEKKLTTHWRKQQWPSRGQQHELWKIQIHWPVRYKPDTAMLPLLLLLFIWLECWFTPLSVLLGFSLFFLSPISSSNARLIGGGNLTAPLWLLTTVNLMSISMWSISRVSERAAQSSRLLPSFFLCINVQREKKLFCCLRFEYKVS